MSSSYYSSLYPMASMSSESASYHQTNDQDAWDGNYPFNPIASHQPSTYCYPQHIQPNFLINVPTAEVTSLYDPPGFGMNNLNSMQTWNAQYNDTIPQLGIGSNVDALFNHSNLNATFNDNSIFDYSNTQLPPSVFQMPVDLNNSGNPPLQTYFNHTSSQESFNSNSASSTSSSSSTSSTSSPSLWPSYNTSPLETRAIIPSSLTTKAEIDLPNFDDTVYRNFFDFLLTLHLPTPSSLEQRCRRSNAKRILVPPTQGSRIKCRWENCGQEVCPTVHDLEAHVSQHVGVIRTCNTDRVFCRWMHEGVACTEDINRTSLVKHIGKHLHIEGQPSPYVSQSVCCGKLYISRGSSTRHFKTCHNYRRN